MTDADQLLERMRGFAAAAQWTFASTMAAFAPHEYAVRQQCRARGIEPLFEQAVADVVQHGQFARWRSQPARRYLEVDGWRYWVMSPWRDDVVTWTTIINRADVSIDIVARVDGYDEPRVDPQTRLDV